MSGLQCCRNISRRELLGGSCLVACAALAWPFVPVVDAAALDRPSKSVEDLYYSRLPGNRTQCHLCPRQRVLEDGQTCFCRTRTNRGGTLYNTAYNNPCALHIDPLEKAPLYHVIPGSKTLALALAGCNLRCLYCQNWEISQKTPSETKNLYMTPSDVVKGALEKGCRFISFSYTEPAAYFRYVTDVAVEAKRCGIVTTVSTASFMNPDPIREWCKTVDIFCVALKGSTEEFYQRVCGASMAPVLRAMEVIREEGKWLEIATLVVPTINDDIPSFRDVSSWICKNLGSDVPLHFVRFSPAYKLRNLPPTPVKTLDTARAVARETGLKYVYVENLPAHEGNSTYCASCLAPIIKRVGFEVIENAVVGGKCRFCGTTIPGIWSFPVRAKA